MTRERNFWSARRRAVEAEAEAEEAAKIAAVEAEETRALEEKSDDEILAELELPAPESLKEGDDFSAFMAKAVPDRIRRRALRVLWRSNPVLANVDMLVDYGEDFTDGANVIENMQTAYQVGKGMMKHVEEMARQAAAKEAEAAREDDNEDDVTPEQEPDVEIAAVAEAETEADEDVSAPAYEFEHTDEDAARDNTTPAPAKRRMRFAFQDN
ncbi:DUF3306 domain-containing protein [Cognatishimia sp. MH4019]|uniref:DUF3306 domain-containing protein n=1 Tax=Cognatishimia sp. MH4019 TaxID=2854030 RepID=UPI001CD44974|nr:DUF3306 domain-containing protein [Cognatishimia sp. MH4019]